MKRQYTIELQEGLPLLNSNQRIHFHRSAKITKAIRCAAWAEACDLGLKFNRIHVLGIICPSSQRRADPANWYPSFKAAIDGLVDAGVIPDDNSKHLEGPDMRRGPVSKWPRLILVITPLGDGETWPDFGDAVKVSIEGGE
jgi:crossover junction endodeoxyribonuclease RusA